MTEEDVMKVPGEIPIIEKRQPARPPSAEKVAPPRSLSTKKDSSLVLSYLKKNMYDDTRKFLPVVVVSMLGNRKYDVQSICKILYMYILWYQNCAF